MKCSAGFVVVVILSTSAVILCRGDGNTTRSRREASPGPSPFPTALSAVKFHVSEGQVENKFKPKFERCEDYLPEVEEEADRGTQVIQVRAEDKDGSDSPAGQIIYSIVSTNNKFDIDKTTGWITTKAIFNRDEPDREKLVYVTVKASDNGRPQLEDVCTLKVKILDKNDNSPVFDRVNYNVPIAQDIPVGTVIMRISATDVDEGDNQKISYDLAATDTNQNDIDYFDLNRDTGVISLRRKLDKPKGQLFLLRATAKDSGNSSRSTSIDISLEVSESSNKPPSFKSGPSDIELDETYHDFSVPIANFSAESNIPGDDTVFFQLVSGRTEKTNKEGTFRAVQDTRNPKSVSIYLAKGLVYEKVNEYALTLQVRNSPDLVAEAQLRVRVRDANNQAPIFTNVESGNVLENEPPGTFVMQVSAVDNDGQYPNNRVSYSISANNDKSIREKFQIHPDTGVISTRTQFDREEQAVYAVTIDAEDGAPSAFSVAGRPNVTPNKFRIAIADKNDNPPYFPQQFYEAEVPEDQDVGSKVIEVRADDLDSEASVTTYQIISGNKGQAFRIEEQTGFIRVAKPLDYESVNVYDLRVGAWDGQYGNETNVRIRVLNVNDVKPQFNEKKYVVEETEEFVPPYAIAQVLAIDPDIADPFAPQNIKYYLDPGSSLAEYFRIDETTGELRIVKKLDRDLPYGYPTWSMYIFAKDENGGPNGIENFVPFEINLRDINDNAPFLDMKDGLVWPEHSLPGVVGVLQADDYDDQENGPPFTFELAADSVGTSGPQVRSLFAVEKADDGTYVLKALAEFDREAQKVYRIPINVCDHKKLCAVSQLDLIIGDKNDNPMEPGFSEILVYFYDQAAQSQVDTTQIGRVFVKDPDDWDLPDKTFTFKEPRRWAQLFGLDRNTGEIALRHSGVDFGSGEELRFSVDFVVEDPTHGQVGNNAVPATVNVTVRRVTREAIMTSGSVRIAGRPEDFVRPDANGYSIKDKFATKMVKLLNATHFDIFTILPHTTSSLNGLSSEVLTDVRFAAHGSPYYASERMEKVVIDRKTEFENSLGISIGMVHIDECLNEKAGTCKGKGCWNRLDIGNRLTTVYTNTSTFVGVQARVVPVCGCKPAAPSLASTGGCEPNPCLNGGECLPAPRGGGVTCRCPDNVPGIFGDRCESLEVSFNGRGWAYHEGLPSCGDTRISLVFNTQYESGTLLYNGPSPGYIPLADLSDFVLLEVTGGKLRLFVNFGAGVRVLDLQQKVDDNTDHVVVLSWTNSSVQMELESCSNQVTVPRENCFVQQSTSDLTHHFLNTNGPLQVGGASFSSSDFASSLAPVLLKSHSGNGPHFHGFAGCVKNLTLYTGNSRVLHNLGMPGDGDNYSPGCDEEFVQAVVALNLNMNFLIAILVCLGIVLLTVLVCAVYRGKRHVYSDKDIDIDIRENIINYEDEGGGEGDQTGYDLSVLRMMADGTPTLHPGSSKINSKMQMEAAPDIQSFLQSNKDRIDGDPEASPFDDLRHYAYEGDVNSIGSLSSLNSSESDADLEFDYLHNFGPRFKKLADMYGEEPDSEDEEDMGYNPHHGHHLHHPNNPYGSSSNRQYYGNQQQPQSPDNDTYGQSLAPPNALSESWC